MRGEIVSASKGGGGGGGNENVVVVETEVEVEVEDEVEDEDEVEVEVEDEVIAAVKTRNQSRRSGAPANEPTNKRNQSKDHCRCRSEESRCVSMARDADESNDCDQSKSRKRV